MKRVRHILGKELLQNRRDPLATLFTIFLPVIFTVVLGLVIGGAENSRLPGHYLIALITALVAVVAAVAWKPSGDRSGRQAFATYAALGALAFLFSCGLLFVVTGYLWN